MLSREPGQNPRAALLLSLLMLVGLLPMVAALDSDGDGVDDTVDDCPYAAGTSSVDRYGCPDADGDGTSDVADPWTTTNPNFTEAMAITTSYSHNAADHSPDGELVATASADRVRIWNTTTHTNVVSSNVLVSGQNAAVNSVAWSPDGTFIAVTLSDDTAALLYASNLSVVHSGITHNGGSRTFSDAAFLPNSTAFAVVDESSGGGGGGCSGCAVMFVDTATGSIYDELTPGNSNTFSSVAFSPDGRRMVAGAGGEVLVVNTSNQITLRALSAGNQNYNAVDISPDGNYVAACSAAWGSGSQLRVWRLDDGASILSKTGSTSCYDAEFSPDGAQVAYALGWYGAEGATTMIYEVSTGTTIQSITTPRPGGCTSFQGNNCGQHNGLSWHPGGYDIVLSVGRNDEGVYFWHADIDPDMDGWNSTDQGDGKVDAFPTDGTQWLDSDGDGFGDNPAPANEPDACVLVPGNSTGDRYGCPDTDGDGYSNPSPGWTADDGADLWPDDPEQWVDSDGDGYGDNYLYTVQQSTQLHVDQRGDAFPDDASQWNDTDGDGWGDNWADAGWASWRPAEWPGVRIDGATQVDAFPLDRTQWLDTDGDGFGDNPNSAAADGCPEVQGNSIWDRLGCPDSDGDGWSDPTVDWTASPECDQADAFPADASQWCDSDGDGYGDNESGTTPDHCPNQGGTSTLDVYGCADRDGDGYSNAGDPFPDDPTQWEDADGDNRGDNPNGSNPDLYPNDSTQWADTDGDGYGDNPSGTNGDRFPYDARQWEDTDGDGFGDNLIDEDGDGLSEAGDVCPLSAGNSNAPISRGCPDTDSDGYTDPVDAFPENPFQWNDTDGDGFGDNSAVNGGDNCVNEFGRSNKMGRFGCPDRDVDGYADVDDAFPDDFNQWADTDGDGFGDNYSYVLVTVDDPEHPGQTLVLREEMGDWMIDNPSQWSDRDGDGFGDNSTGFQGDKFPLRSTQWADFDGDGFGDNTVFNLTNPTYQPDDCRKEFGTSTIDRFGCVDYDEDGVSDLNDPCKYDPSISTGTVGQVTCTITKPTDDGSGAGGGGEGLAANIDLVTVALVVVVALVGAGIGLAMIARKAGRAAVMQARAEAKLTDASFHEEEERRKEWIRYYVAQGQLEEARALGWMGEDVATSTAAVPQWKQYEMEQQAAQQAALPSMPDLDNL
jgi:WD40 repeat protein